MAFRNFSYGRVLTAPSPASSGTSITLESGQGARMPAVPFKATIWPYGFIALTSNAEIVNVTARPGNADTFTITRAQEGTSARAVQVGDQFAATLTQGVLDDIIARIEALEQGGVGGGGGGGGTILPRIVEIFFSGASVPAGGQQDVAIDPPLTDYTKANWVPGGEHVYTHTDGTVHGIKGRVVSNSVFRLINNGPASYTQAITGVIQEWGAETALTHNIRKVVVNTTLGPGASADFTISPALTNYTKAVPLPVPSVKTEIVNSSTVRVYNPAGVSVTVDAFVYIVEHDVPPS